MLGFALQSHLLMLPQVLLKLLLAKIALDQHLEVFQ